MRNSLPDFQSYKLNDVAMIISHTVIQTNIKVLAIRNTLKNMAVIGNGRLQGQKNNRLGR